MKTFKDYLTEEETSEQSPSVGDVLEIELTDQIVEAVVVDITDEGYICETDNLTGYTLLEETLTEAKYQGREVPLGKKMKGDVKKSKVYVKGPKGNVVKVNFGDPNMRIKKSSPARRKSFRARHNCANPGPRWKARYWSCRAW
jgi:hypothetical protein